MASLRMVNSARVYLKRTFTTVGYIAAGSKVPTYYTYRGFLNGRHFCVSSRAEDIETRIKQLQDQSPEPTRKVTDTIESQLDAGNHAVDVIRTADGIEYKKGDGVLVYRGEKGTQVTLLKLFSVFNSFLFIGLQPIMYHTYSEIHGGPILEAPYSVLITYATLVTFCSVVQTTLVYLLCKRYVSKLYLDYENKQFTAYTLSFLGRERVWKFAIDPLNIVKGKNSFTTVIVNAKGRGNTTHKVPLLVDPKTFLDRDAYVYLMGYDQPMDLTIDPEDPTLFQQEKVEFEKEMERLNAEFARTVAREEANPYQQQLDRIKTDIEKIKFDGLDEGKKADIAQNDNTKRTAIKS